MIFRDVKSGALLNIRHDDFINDRLYYMDIIKHSTPFNNTGNGSNGGGIGGGNNKPGLSSMLFPHGGNEYNIPSWVHSVISSSNNNNA
jgi:hypothetical protein